MVDSLMIKSIHFIKLIWLSRNSAASRCSVHEIRYEKYLLQADLFSCLTFCLQMPRLGSIKESSIITLPLARIFDRQNFVPDVTEKERYSQNPSALSKQGLYRHAARAWHSEAIARLKHLLKLATCVTTRCA